MNLKIKEMKKELRRKIFPKKNKNSVDYPEIGVSGFMGYLENDESFINRIKHLEN